MNPVEELIEANSLTVAVERAEANPMMAQPCEDMDHWRCEVSGGGVEGFEFYVSLGGDFAGQAPLPAEALSRVVDDVRAFRDCAGYADFATLLGIGDGEQSPEALAAWGHLARLSASIAAIESLSATPATAA